MDERSISLVQESYRKLIPISERAGSIFFARLRDRHPTIYISVTKTLDPDAHHVVSLLGMVVESFRKRRGPVCAPSDLRGPDSVEHLLGAHHAAVEVALVWTLRRSLRKDFTPEVELAWVDAITAFSLSVFQARTKFASRRPVGTTLH